MKVLAKIEKKKNGLCNTVMLILKNNYKSLHDFSSTIVPEKGFLSHFVSINSVYKIKLMDFLL